MILIRTKKNGNAVTGELYFGDRLICCTLERADKLIPRGLYKVEVNKSPKFSKLRGETVYLPLLYNDKVSATRGIRIHAGNTIADTAGCVLVGAYFENNKLQNSRPFEALVTQLCKIDRSLLICESF